MTGQRSVPRALAFAAAIPVLVALGGAAQAARGLTGGEALALHAGLTAAIFGLAGLAGASLSRAPLAARLGLGPGRLGGADSAWAIAGLLGLSHAAEAAIAALGLESQSALLRFETALEGLGPAALALPLAVLGLATPIGEELFFRGFLQRGLAATAGPATAIGLSAAAFGVAHGDWVHGGAAALLGLYLGALAQGAGSIRLAIAAHAVNNAVAVLESAAGLGLPESGALVAATAAAGAVLAFFGLRAALRPRAAAAPVTAALQSEARPAEQHPG